MSEDITANNEEVVEEESTQETDEQEVTTDESDEETSTEEMDTDQESGEESSEEETEQWESEAEYLKQFELPGDPQSVDDVIENYKNVAPELKRLQNELRDIRANTQTQEKVDVKPSAKSPAIFKGGTFQKTFDELSKSGQIPDEYKENYRSMAVFNDKAMAAVSEEIETVFNALANGIVSLRRDMQWNNFKGKGAIDREMLEPLMDKHQFSDYQEAVYQASIQDPGILSKINVKQGQEKKGKKKLRKFSSNRRKKTPATSKAGNVSQYINKFGEIDRAKLDRLPYDKKMKILDSITEAAT